MTSPSFTARPAVDSDVEAIRVLRNAGRAWFGDKHEVGVDEQARWWARVSFLTPREFYCLVLEVRGQVVGYGYWHRRSDGRAWVSLAVAEAMRGRGAGRRIYRLLAAARDGHLFAGIRKDNQASARACEHAGYVEVFGISPPGVAEAERGDWRIYAAK